jgi:hypothetical protein
VLPRETEFAATGIGLMRELSTRRTYVRCGGWSSPHFDRPDGGCAPAAFPG